MFLLARLHVESLASAAALSVKHVRKKLQAFPNTLTGAYDNTMQRIQDPESDHKRIAFKTLAWLTHAIRSMSLKELQHALAIEPGDTELDDELLMDGHSITSLCAGLVTLDQGMNMVNLVHYRTKTYFEENQKNISQAFCEHDLEPGDISDIKRVIGCSNQSSLCKRIRLLCYAAQYL